MDACPESDGGASPSWSEVVWLSCSLDLMILFPSVTAVIVIIRVLG